MTVLKIKNVIWWWTSLVEYATAVLCWRANEQSMTKPAVALDFGLDPYRYYTSRYFIFWDSNVPMLLQQQQLKSSKTQRLFQGNIGKWSSCLAQPLLQYKLIMIECAFSIFWKNYFPNEMNMLFMCYTLIFSSASSYNYVFYVFIVRLLCSHSLPRFCVCRMLISSALVTTWTFSREYFSSIFPFPGDLHTIIINCNALASSMQCSGIEGVEQGNKTTPVMIFFPNITFA